MFYSQAGQDVYVLNRYGNRGFFVDIGAHDGVESSNTYALEKAGWRGICVEPNNQSYKTLCENRKAYCCKMYVGRGVVIPGLPDVVDYLSIDVDGEEEQVLKQFPFTTTYVRFITVEHNKYSEGVARQERIHDYLISIGFTRTHKDVKCLDGEWFGLIYEDWYENNNDQPKG